jgi:glycerophosphoryl diester phosphodiesterase
MWQQTRNECGWIFERCRDRFRCALKFSLAFKALNLIVLAPLAALILRLCLKVWGRASVGNFELAAFFLSPVGLTALVVVGGLLLATLYLELAGLMRLLADDRLNWWEAFKSSTHLLRRLVRLGLLQLAMYLLLAVPFLAGIGLAYWWFWSGKDLNGLIILKPPEFWWGAFLAGLSAAVYGFFAARMFLRQLYAVPIMALEGEASVRKALHTSAERSRGTLLRCAGALAVWIVVQGLVASTILGGLHLLLLSILNRSSSSLTLVVLATGAVLAIQTVAATLLSVLANISFMGVVLSLYRQVAPARPLPDHTAAVPSPRSRSIGWQVAGSLVVWAVVAVVVSVVSIRDLKLDENLEITAHRAGAAGAPENTVAALNRAIADGADWAEIDVQLTADKKLVIMHDIDLARVGGGNRRVDQATLEEIQALDVGTPFGQQYAGERIPKLEEILAAAGDRIRLNVELKPHGESDAAELTRRVIEELRQANMVPRCRLCSQSYESLQLARQLEPNLPVGYIVATSIGDSTKLDVNFLMVKSKLATRDLVDRAALRGIAIHAWTVNDPSEVATLLDAGVANLITDDPAQMRAKMDEIRGLSTPERLLLRAAHAMSRGRRG